MSDERNPHLQDDEKAMFRVREDVLAAKAAAKAVRDAAFTAGVAAHAIERPRGGRMTIPVDVVEAPAPVEPVAEAAPEPVAAPEEPPPAFNVAPEPPPADEPAPAPAPRVRSRG